MRLNKFVPFLLALVIHLLPLTYLLFRQKPQSPELSSSGQHAPQGIDLTGFSTVAKKHSSRPAEKGLSSAKSGPEASAASAAPAAASGSTGNGQPSPGTGTGTSSGSGSASNSIVLSSVEPVYPPLARQKGYEGSVKLKAHYDNQGVITSVEILNSSGTKMLDESARRALLSWKLKAGAEGSFEKTFQFKLNN